jgi:integrase
LPSQSIPPSFAQRVTSRLSWGGALFVPKHVYRAAITTPLEAGALLRTIEALEDHPTTSVALRLLPHVVVRPGELRSAEWADFYFDKAFWTIPPHTTKMRRTQSVPLSRQALHVIESSTTPSTARIFSRHSDRSNDRWRRTPSTQRFGEWAMRETN